MKRTITILLLLLALCFNIFAQTIVDAEPKPQMIHIGVVIGEKPDYAVLANNIEYLKSLDRPELSLTFYTDFKIDLESIDEVNEILNSHWKEAIKFYHKLEIIKFSNAKTQTKKTLKWASFSDKTSKKLQNESINSPKRKRNIFDDEASQMVSYLNKSALELINKAKGKDGTYTNIKIKKKTFAKTGGLCQQYSGQAKFSVTFDKSGEVTDVIIKQKSGCAEFDRSSYNATKKIKFEPAKINDEPITVVKSVIYSFRR